MVDNITFGLKICQSRNTKKCEIIKLRKRVKRRVVNWNFTATFYFNANFNNFAVIYQGVSCNVKENNYIWGLNLLKDISNKRLS